MVWIGLEYDCSFVVLSFVNFSTDIITTPQVTQRKVWKSCLRWRARQTPTGRGMEPHGSKLTTRKVCVWWWVDGWNDCDVWFCLNFDVVGLTSCAKITQIVSMRQSWSLLIMQFLFTSFILLTSDYHSFVSTYSLLTFLHAFTHIFNKQVAVVARCHSFPLRNGLTP